MNDPDLVASLDSTVRGRLQMALLKEGRPGDPPHAVNVIVDDLSRAVRFKRWFLISCHCSILGELIFASTSGGIYKVQEKKGTRRDYYHSPLSALRNACFHPALVSAQGKDKPAMERLVAYIDRDDHQLAALLGSSWPRLREKGVAAWAIMRLNAAGRHELGELR